MCINISIHKTYKYNNAHNITNKHKNNNNNISIKHKRITLIQNKKQDKNKNTRHCEGEDSRQRGHPTRSTETHIRGQAIGGWPYLVRLQHPEGVHLALGASLARRHANLCEDIDGQNYHIGC